MSDPTLIEPGAKTPEGTELIRKLRVALAETGFGDADFREEGVFTNGFPNISQVGVPDGAWWRACRLVVADKGWPTTCWSCYLTADDDRIDACLLGDCQAGPDTPKVPPRRVGAR